MAASKSDCETLGVVSISVPVGVVQFLKDLASFGNSEIDPQAWAENQLRQSAIATIDQMSDDEFLVAARLKAKYGLQDVQV